MDDSELLDRLHGAIASAYVTPAQPRYDFVQRALRSYPHGFLLQAFAQAGFTVSDTTDGNEDVAWHLGLKRGGDEVDVAISMAGPYARISRPVQAVEADKLREELTRLLSAHGLVVIPEHLLCEPTSVVTDDGNADIAQALFAVTEGS